MRNKLVVVILLSIFSFSISAQEKKPQYFYGGFGFTGAKYDSNIDGLGHQTNLGYQSQLSSRYGYNLGFNHASYSNRLSSDVTIAHFTISSFDAGLYLNCVNIGDFSIFVGTGAHASFASGHSVESVDYLQMFHLAVNGQVGFRFIPNNKKLSCEILLADANFGKNDYFQISITKLRIGFRF